MCATALRDPSADAADLIASLATLTPVSVTPADGDYSPATNWECTLSIVLQFLGQALYAQLFAVMANFVRHSNELLDNFRSDVQQVVAVTAVTDVTAGGGPTRQPSRPSAGADCKGVSTRVSTRA